MFESIFIILIVLFVLSCIGFVISLFYTKKSLMPMIILVIVVNVINIGIQIVATQI